MERQRLSAGVLVIATLSILFLAAPARSQNVKRPSLAELAASTGADRDRVLIEGAQREGKVSWYTTLAARQNKDIAKAFEKKYPGVKVETYRTGSGALIQRVLTEAQARRHLVDAIETTLPGLKTFRNHQLLMPYTSPYLGEFPQESKENAPNHLVYWVIVRESYVGFAYNTKLIKPTEVPKNFDGLLNPALKDRMAMSGEETGARTIGAMLKVKGEAFVRKLKEQNITLHMIAGSALTQLVASGEAPASPSQFYSATHVAMKAGAPLAWVPLDLVVTSGGGAAVYANAPRPYAALLFVEFLQSPEGQQLYENLYFGSPRKDYGFKRWYPDAGLTVSQYEKMSEKWHKLLMEISRK